MHNWFEKSWYNFFNFIYENIQFTSNVNRFIVQQQRPPSELRRKVGFNGDCSVSRNTVISKIVSRPNIDTLSPRHIVHHFVVYRFKVIFFSKGLFILIQILMKFISNCPVNNTITGTDHGLAPKRHQSIIWPNGGLVYWCIIHPSFELDELINHQKQPQI